MSIVTTTPRSVPRAEIAAALRRGAWSCFVTPRDLPAARVKVSKAARGLPYRTLYEDGRLIAYLPVLGGEEEPPSSRELDDRRATAEMHAIVRVELQKARSGGAA